MLSTLSLAEVGLVTYPWSVTMVTCLQTISANNKKVQSANLMAGEKKFLVELALKYQAVIENKNSDKVTAYFSCVQNSNNNELSWLQTTDMSRDLLQPMTMRVILFNLSQLTLTRHTLVKRKLELNL